MAINDPNKDALFGGRPRGDDRPGPHRRQDALGNKIPNPEEELVLIEKEIHELKIAFEQYFLGVDRQSPVRRKDQLGERIRRLKNSGTLRNTALKFRLEQLQSKFGTYDRMWARTVSEIESGTYKRDLFKAKLHQKERAQKEALKRLDKAEERKDGEEPAADEKKPAAARPAPAARPEGAMLSEGQLRSLYDTYVLARQRTNESTGGITFDALSQTLRRQVPELLQKHQCKAIDFKVVIKGGKALLKAVPRK